MWIYVFVKTGKEEGMKTRTFFILVDLVMLLVLAGVNSSLAVDKTTLRYGIPTKFASLDQYKSTQRITIQMEYLIWDPLVTRDPDSGKINPHLAQSWANIDSTTWEFKLVPGVKFHSGNPLNAECVRFSIEDRILAVKNLSDSGTVDLGNVVITDGLAGINDRITTRYGYGVTA